MVRALVTLLAGILLAVLVAAALAGGVFVTVLGPVLVTTAAGLAVMAVVAGRARIRERAQQLEGEDLRGPDRSTVTDASTRRPDDRVTDEDTDRG